MLLLFLSVILIGGLVAFVAYRKRIVQGRNTIILGGLSASCVWLLIWAVSIPIGKSSLYPRRRIVTDGTVFEIETQYYPFSSWHRSYREFSSVEAIKKYLNKMDGRELLREEHESRQWKEVK